jgi:hypothetical protein
MGKFEKIVSIEPPAATKPAVMAHRRTLELERDVLRAGTIELAVASAMGDVDARNTLAALPAKLAALQFEIDLNHQAQELAHAEDAAAETAWRKSIQTMDPEEIIAGIGKNLCCSRCTHGIPNGCVITASAQYAGSTCAHPVKQKHLFCRDEKGQWNFPFRSSPQASRVFDAACEKLGVGKEFS